MRKLICLRGIPASGKSTWARELVIQEPNKWKRVNRDDIREMTGVIEWSKKSEDFTVKVQNAIVRQALIDGYNVVVDNCHIAASSVKILHQIAESLGGIAVIEKFFDVNIKECLERNAKRIGKARVPDHVLLEMSKKTKNIPQEKITVYNEKTLNVIGKQDEKLPKAIICDLDGTLSLLNGRSPYDASTCQNDLPNVPVIECVRAMASKGYNIIFMSGREDKYREQTENFIEQYCWVFKTEYEKDEIELDDAMKVIPHQLYMRKSGDQRKDSIVKRELFDANISGKHYVEFALDDRDQVVSMFREIGIPVFQVNYGDF
jgi:predicted kinase